MKKFKKMHKLVLLSSLAAILTGGVAISSTYALFTSEAETKVVATAGKVSVTSEITDLKTYSGENLIGDVSKDTSISGPISGNTFTNGGIASIDNDKKTLTLTNITPGDKVTFNIKVTNNSTVAIKYRTKINYDLDDSLLSEALKVTISDQTFSKKIITSYKALSVGSGTETIPVIVEMPSNAGNEYQGLSCTLSYVVEAIQGNAVGEIDSYPVYPAGITDNDFKDDNTLAYYDSNGAVQYSKDFASLVTSSSISTIYCKANSNFTNSQAHLKFNRNLTIYGNDSNFNYTDLSVLNYDNTHDLTQSVSVKFYDTNNLSIWGSAIPTNITLDVYMEGCTITGETSYDTKYLLFTKSQEDTNQGTLNATFKNCKATDVQYAYSTSSKGKSTFEGCVFRDSYMGIKTKLKSTTSYGTRTDTIKNCLFVNCGAVTGNEIDQYSAPISYSNDYDSNKYHGTLTLNSINNKFYNSIGENGDILLGDNRTQETFNAMTLNLESKDSVTVRKAHSSIDTYAAGTHTITCPARTSAN